MLTWKTLNYRDRSISASRDTLLHINDTRSKLAFYFPEYVNLLIPFNKFDKIFRIYNCIFNKLFRIAKEYFLELVAEEYIIIFKRTLVIYICVHENVFVPCGLMYY